TAAALTVLEPASNGIGGDAFALVWHQGEMHGLNGSGRAPALCTPEAMQRIAGDEIPERGWLPGTVPRVPRAWVDLHERFGRLPLTQVLAPAAEYARVGYPLSPVLAEVWARDGAPILKHHGPQFEPWRQTFYPVGFKPGPGVLWRCEAQAKTLESIAASRG